MNSPVHILYLGPKWRGCDARALAQALRREGCTLTEVDCEDFVPPHWSGMALRVLRRLLSPLLVRAYNRAVSRYAENRSLDFVLVFKGMYLGAETLQRFAVPRYCVYPDVSFTDHGSSIWGTLPVYDCVFTTKAFHLEDPRVTGRARRLELVSHGADPDVHRPVHASSAARAHYGCDVAFVGCWSPKKEGLLSALLQRTPAVGLAIWGPGWERAKRGVRACWRGGSVFGDELALVYACARINLGLLSEAGGGPGAAADTTTARTWQIPASGGFMLHERTAEVCACFEEGAEIACFDGPEDLAAKVSFYRERDDLRASMAAEAHRRFKAGSYTYDAMALQILDFHRRGGGRAT